MRNELMKYVWSVQLAKQEEETLRNLKNDYLLGNASADALADAMLSMNATYLKVSRVAVQVVTELCHKEGLI